MQEDKNKNTPLTIGDAADYLGISIDTLRRWEKKGRVEPLRSPGGHRYYKKEDLDNLFGKKYVREEETNRPEGPYNTFSSNTPVTNTSTFPSGYNDSTKLTDTIPPQPFIQSSNINLPTQDQGFNKQEVSTPEVVAETQHIKQPLAPEPQTAFYGHPIGKPYTPAPPAPELPKVEEPQVFTNFPFFERPPREVKIPEHPNIQVVKEGYFAAKEETPGEVLTSQEAYYRQQSLSVLTPPEIKNSEPKQTTANNSSSVSPVYTQQPSPKKEDVSRPNSLTINKNYFIYGGILLGILFLILAWYAIWISSQRVLSPIP